MVGPERFERPTPSFVAKCSIQLSYGPVFWSQNNNTTKAKGRNQKAEVNAEVRVRTQK